MNTEEILEYNKRCAEFLGFKYKNQAKFWVIYPLDNSSFLRQLGYVRMDSLKFHSDWNWIMEVVEKITSIELTNNKNECNYIYIGFDYTDQSHYVNLYHGECNGGQINGYSKTSKKEAVVQAINQFLIWYKEQTT